MRALFLLLAFLTMGMPSSYHTERMIVKDVTPTSVLFADTHGRRYIIPADECWAVGDEAEAIARCYDILDIRYTGLD